ncbi:MAG: DNA polymerase III subunit delta [Actinobacteria bacterium]|nr:DNA polymerase III subunit delta [Actinomycetota bacterium]
MPPELKPAYLIAGGDRPKVDLAVGRLRTRVGRDAVEELDAAQASGADAVAACMALGLLAAEARVVLVRGVDAWKAADAKAVAAYLASPTPGTVLALTGEAVKADSALAKAVAKTGELLLFTVDKKHLPEWVRKQFAAQGAQADIEACRALVQIAVPEGGDVEARHLNQLASEVVKLATWAGAEPVTERDVEELAVPFGEPPSFTLTDAWGRRDAGAVLRAAEALLERDERPRRDVVPRLVGSLVSHVDRVRQCQSLAAGGVRAREAAATLKRHPFYVQKLYAQAESYSVEELRGAVVRLAELDAALKGASRLAGDLELQRALVDVTRPAGASR